MEQAQQYHWRSKLMFMNNVIDHHSSSWEEKAFAEDHHGGIGGCIWPPRSYSCSFCKREFRSAQALGGHMNVHRKDRARLKQSSSSSSPEHRQHHCQTNDHVCVRPNDDHHNLKSFDSHHHQHHPNSSSSTVLASTLSSPTSRVSELSTTQNFSSYHYFVKQHKGSNVSSISKPEVVKNPREEASTICLSDKNDSNLVGTNNLFCSKRAKTEIFTLSFLSKPCSNDRCGFLSEVPGRISSSLEDIDLELRLGQPPKVN